MVYVLHVERIVQGNGLTVWGVTLLWQRSCPCGAHSRGCVMGVSPPMTIFSDSVADRVLYFILSSCLLLVMVSAAIGIPLIYLTETLLLRGLKSLTGTASLLVVQSAALVWGNYRIIYRIEVHQVSILTVRHTKQILLGLRVSYASR